MNQNNELLTIPKSALGKAKRSCLLNSLSIPSRNMKMLNVKINNVTFQSLVDTGSTHCLISVESFNKLSITNYERISMVMKVAGSSLKHNIVGCTTLTIELETESPKLYTKDIRFLIAHHINGYDIILGADFLLNPLYVVAITPYTVMLFGKSTVCAPFVSKNGNSKTLLLNCSESFSIPVQKTVDVKLQCANNTILGDLIKFTPLITFLSKGILVKSLHNYSNNCTITVQNVGTSHVEVARNSPIGLLEIMKNSCSLFPTVNPNSETSLKDVPKSSHLSLIHISEPTRPY